jgi:hypothetical protein
MIGEDGDVGAVVERRPVRHGERDALVIIEDGDADLRV